MVLIVNWQSDKRNNVLLNLFLTQLNRFNVLPGFKKMSLFN